ncbi:Stk1 family PASTA domain-containing Ser/Thr kinase [Haloechinothrix sp. LS1_15]|uniref:Stk1 family PASTA domain-containing Ser/Thr kinase n=1 Tax=Haloechinothrix sp. LS1_15 TaxID=2652248 RepID=UPI0029444D38|nr:Stk1 family PASTA domain-containing Ser/Thr kinase [Haloechinothrix sp. LS1_15]MDV6010907.1 Stk1 family PASTA domain-containing Ser/Thr kinase [Haloechinothrix sp. LS1_15]
MSTANLLSDRYQLGDTLGYGGMSEVYHGHDVRLDREVAVKILREDLARDPIFQERFRREAQNAAALNHPAIVAVYDTGETASDSGRLPYIVMEYVDGRTLRDIVKTEGPMSSQRAMEVMADVCAALDFSHRHGIVHRDVKPANVMITNNGAVKVMDFGIARAIHDGQAAMTQTAAVIGTAQYLSPEQARGDSVDARSDVYAAGCVLYELVAGQPPFTGDSPVSVAYQHVREDPVPPSTINPEVNPSLDAVVLKALTKGPANRYQSAAEMRSDLVRVLANERPVAPAVMTDEDRTQVLAAGSSEPDDTDYDELDEEERRKRRNRMLLVLAAVAIAAIAFIMWLAGLFDVGERDAEIPMVVGQEYSSAERSLRDAGFNDLDRQSVPCWPQAYGEEPPCTADDVGKVVDTDPEQGTTHPVTTEIVVQVGAPPEVFDMPDLTGMSADEAEQVVDEHDLLLDPTQQEIDNNDPDRAGQVAEHTPEAGEATEQGEVVTLSVYAEPEMVEVTDYVGETFDIARTGLEAAGFEVNRQDVDSSEPEGTVVDQSPRSGEAVAGSEVTVQVSTGADESMDMPDVIGMTEGDARSALDDAGHIGEVQVVTREVRDPREDGEVIASNPDAGDEMTRSSGVTLAVGEFNPGDDDDDDDDDNGIFDQGRPRN